ncbi:UNVERIFIED_CONTAM: U-box domain-containing protein 35 [Sesamum calycinum]|uniref:RING-type E3 ubiquitin transferase n=1 Tax=Sesamum calycinum TaxID=2727403 RepID=A0AAW2JDE6_9LAMI
MVPTGRRERRRRTDEEGEGPAGWGRGRIWVGRARGWEVGGLGGRHEKGCGGAAAAKMMASQGGVEIGQEGVGADAPLPPGGAPVAELPPAYAQIFQMAFQAQAQAQAQLLAQAQAPTPAPTPVVPTIDRNYERIRKMGATEFEGTLDPEVAERWWEKVEDVMNLVGCTPENRLKYIVSLFVGNALIWWRSLKRAYEPREITWAEFQREFDDKYRPKMYRDKKRMEFLNLVQGDEQTVVEYELRFVALAKYAPEAVATHEDRCYRFEQGLRLEIKRGLAVRIINFKTLVESAVRMEEAIIEDKRKGEEKRKSTYTVGESSRLTKRGTGRSFSAGGGNFLRGGSGFRGSSGPTFGGPMGFNRGPIDCSSSTMPSIGSGKGVGQGYRRGITSIPNCSICGRRHLGQCWGPGAIPRICYNCRGRGHMSRDCPSQTMSLVGSASSGNQSQSSVGSSGRGVDRGRGRAGAEALVTEMVTTLLVWIVDCENRIDVSMEEKNINKGEGLDKLPPPAYSVAAVAVSGSRRSKYVVKWALEKFVPEGLVYFRLLHVRPVINRIPTPMGNLIPISQVRDDVATAFRKDVEWQATEKLLPYKRMCDQRKVEVEIVQIESDDVVTAVAGEIRKHKISKLVIGASSRSIFSRHVAKACIYVARLGTSCVYLSFCCTSFIVPYYIFLKYIEATLHFLTNTITSLHVQGTHIVSKNIRMLSDVCTVYAVSKGKLSSLRPSDSDTNASFRDDSSDTSHSTDNSSSIASSSQTDWTEQGSIGSFSHFRSASLPDQRFQALSTINQTLLHKRTPSSGIIHPRNLSLDIAGRSNETNICPSGSYAIDTISQASSFTSSEAENPSWGQASTSEISTENQANIDFELEKLRIELRHIRGMYAMAQGEAIDASRKLKDIQKRRLEEEINLKQISLKEAEAEELARQEKERHEAARREAEFVKECAERETAERKEAEIRASRETKEKEKLESALNGSFYRYRQFTWDEIISATSSFSENLQIGMGAYGAVYQCSFQHTTAAVKILHAKEASRNKQFQQELEILSQIRHPHLLILLGACPDHGCLVYEFMENGSLEDRLFRKNNTPPLLWFDRFRIAWEVASALVFLHNSKPKAIIHRDLKPANILLDRNNLMKWKLAVENNRLVEVLDPEAGPWPVEETNDLVLIALKCTELRRRDRPDLRDEVLPVLEKMKDNAETARNSTLISLPPPPDHFKCPILKV